MGDGALRVTRDRAHLGHYQIEIEAEVGLDVDVIGKALESSRYGLADFDEWGRTYLSAGDPYLEIDVDALDDYGDRSRLRMRKSRIPEREVSRMKGHLLEAYCSVGRELAALSREYCTIAYPETNGY
jgi:hypothetical protein